MGLNVAAMSATDKISEAIRRSKRHLPDSLARQLDALLTPENLALMAGTLAVWAGSHFFGVGEVVDVGLLLIGAFFIGWSITDVVKSLVEFGTTAINARTEDDLDRAGKHFAHAAVTGGLTAIMAILLRRSAKGLQASRGATIGEVMKPAKPGLVKVAPDTQPGQAIRKPTVTGDPSLPPGRGSTNAFGDVRFSTQGSAAEQQLTRLHELVHSFFSPRLRPFRTFRARLAMSGYSRSAILRYLEEALAESFAQVRVNGLGGLLTGIRFPVANGYMSLQQLACEGAEIGTIVFGTERFSVQFVPEAPANAAP